MCEETVTSAATVGRRNRVTAKFRFHFKARFEATTIESTVDCPLVESLLRSGQFL
jgi:hypothetical protein